MYAEDIVDEILAQLGEGSEIDYVAMREWLTTAGSIVSTVLGIAAGIAIMLITLIIAIELMYINFPMFEDGADRISEKGEGWQKATNRTLKDAKTALERSRTVEIGGSANWIYFKIKSKTVLILAGVIALTLGMSNGALEFLWKIGAAIANAIK